MCYFHNHIQTSLCLHFHKLCPHRQRIIHLSLSPKIYEQVKLKWAHMPCIVIIIPSISHAGDTIIHTTEHAFLYTEASSQVTKHSSLIWAHSIITTLYGWTRLRKTDQAVRSKRRGWVDVLMMSQVRNVVTHPWCTDRVGSDELVGLQLPLYLCSNPQGSPLNRAIGCS